MLRPRERPQLFVFCYHKSGTQLFAKLLADLARRFDLRMVRLLGLVEQVDPTADVALFSHSLLGFSLADVEYRGVRIVRDPRGIWTSGYWYHRRCTEHWCVNTDFDATAPIGFPQVPYSQAHRPEVWKREYLAGLDGRSYQQNLLTRDLREGLSFEEQRYARWTADAMAQWRPDDRTIDVQLETITRSFDASMAAILRHLGFAGERLAEALEIGRAHDIARMSDEAVSRNPHITSRNISHWHECLPADMRHGFEQRHAALIASLGYTV
ncbi:MAG: hypothetical protein WDN25_15525 [Acetobacteraceae bacterium]